MLIRTGTTAVLGLAAVSGAAAVKIQPDEAASQDTFVYQLYQHASAGQIYAGIPGGNASMADPILATTKSPLGHSMHSLIRFDLTGVTIDPGEKVVFGLYVRPAAFGSATPSPTYAAPVSVYAAESAWTESVTWATQPGTQGGALDTVNVAGIDQFIEFDVTVQVQAWLGGASNNGFVISQDAVVVDLDRASQNLPAEVGVFFRGAGWSDPTQRPYLQVIPEPAVLSILSLGAMISLRRKRGVR